MINLDQELVDWHILHEAVSDAIDNAEGKPSGSDLQRAFKNHGLLIIHEEDIGLVPEREAFWLVERKVQPPQYVGTGSGWTQDPWRATRFDTERQAHDHWRTMPIFREESAPVEHVFLNKNARQGAVTWTLDR